MTIFDKATYADRYVELIGEVPEGVEERWDWLETRGRSRAARHVEGLREQAIHLNPMGMRVTQLVQFGQLLVLGREHGAQTHAEAAVRHGATIDELIGVSEVAFVSAGALAYNLGVACARSVERQLDEDAAREA